MSNLKIDSELINQKHYLLSLQEKIENVNDEISNIFMDNINDVGAKELLNALDIRENIIKSIKEINNAIETLNKIIYSTDIK
jgi:hypothetical protein